ncbi:hypothetical protein [Micromonospora arida]
MPDTTLSLQRRLFGLPPGADASTAISYRDATDRVATITDPAQLAELMQRASTSGDAMLLRAGLAHAYQCRWRDLVAAYGGQDVTDLLTAA